MGLLRGAHLALVGHNEASARTRQLMDAAAALGARLALLDRRILDGADAKGGQDALRLLGRLYAGLDCDVADPALVARVAAESGLRVSTLVTEGTPSAALIDQLASEADAAAATPAGSRAILLQAGLLAFFGGDRT